MSNDLRNQSPDQFDIDSLVEQAQQLLQRGDYGRALVLLRDGVREAPLRRDLRDMLSVAIDATIELKGRAGVTETPSAPPLRPSGDPAVPSPATRSHQARPGDPIPPREGPSGAAGSAPAGTTRPGSRESTPGFRAPHRRSQQRGPISYLAIGSAVAVILMVLLVLGLVQVFYQTEPSGLQEQAGAEEMLRRQDEALIEMADAYQNQNLFSQAIDQYNLLSDGPRKEQLLTEAFAHQGDLYSREKRYGEAGQAYEQALEHDSGNVELIENQGWSAFWQGRQLQTRDQGAARGHLDRAEAFFKTARDLRPESLQVLEGLARVEIARDNIQAAADYCRQIIRLAPDSAEAKWARGTLQDRGWQT